MGKEGRSTDWSFFLRLSIGKPFLKKDVLVVVKRGNNCDYVKCGSKLPPKVKDLFESKGWEKISVERLLGEAESNPTAHL